MREPFLGNCFMCHGGPKMVRYVNLYTHGSEGTDLCHECEMKVVEFIRTAARTAVEEKIQAFRKQRSKEMV